MRRYEDTIASVLAVAVLLSMIAALWASPCDGRWPDRPTCRYESR